MARESKSRFYLPQRVKKRVPLIHLSFQADMRHVLLTSSSVIFEAFILIWQGNSTLSACRHWMLGSCVSPLCNRLVYTTTTLSLKQIHSSAASEVIDLSSANVWPHPSAQVGSMDPCQFTFVWTPLSCSVSCKRFCAGSHRAPPISHFLSGRSSYIASHIVHREVQHASLSDSQIMI